MSRGDDDRSKRPVPDPFTDGALDPDDLANALGGWEAQPAYREWYADRAAEPDWPDARLWAVHEFLSATDAGKSPDAPVVRAVVALLRDLDAVDFTDPGMRKGKLAQALKLSKHPRTKERRKHAWWESLWTQFTEHYPNASQNAKVNMIAGFGTASIDTIRRHLRRVGYIGGKQPSDADVLRRIESGEVGTGESPGDPRSERRSRSHP